MVSYDRAINRIKELETKEAYELCELFLDDVVSLQVKYRMREELLAEKDNELAEAKRAVAALHKSSRERTLAYEEKLRDKENSEGTQNTLFTKTASISTRLADFVQKRGGNQNQTNNHPISNESDASNVFQRLSTNHTLSSQAKVHKKLEEEAIV
jgi:hypothetical protein